ncbi:hypothetical protein J5N97_020992 [Dioscorea zingiberensis]|uniref:RING-type domain-containing protein n=1 Tax=Dioscorea zingiberensis TaxID=325984 RepID=A0A9D5CGU8_9LILI|nr:hypothetical protein J5N97_020992 [Dioscorea zingiberensis]
MQYTHTFTQWSTIAAPTEIINGRHTRNQEFETSPRVIIHFEIIHTTYYCTKFPSKKVILDHEEHSPTSRPCFATKLQHFLDWHCTQRTVSQILNNPHFTHCLSWSGFHYKVTSAIHCEIPPSISSDLSELIIHLEIKPEKYMVRYMNRTFLWECSVMEVRYEESQVEPCVICLEELVAGDELRRLLCSHDCFHSECLSRWLEKNDSCPICWFTEETPSGIRTDFVYPYDEDDDDPTSIRFYPYATTMMMTTMLIEDD